jgi:hypothetical protein
MGWSLNGGHAPLCPPYDSISNKNAARDWAAF